MSVCVCEFGGIHRSTEKVVSKIDDFAEDIYQLRVVVEEDFFRDQSASELTLRDVLGELHVVCFVAIVEAGVFVEGEA